MQGNTNILLFALFILTSLLITGFLRASNKWKGLLFTSLAFYYFLFDLKIVFLFLLGVLIYYSAFIIQKTPSKLKYLVVLILVPLVVEKLTNNSLHFQPLSDTHITLSKGFSFSELITIAGLSYFTFNGISYLVDVKRRYIEPEKNIFFLLLYLSYFPAILSGPLHRYKYLKNQFEQIQFTNENFVKGMRLILWGLFKNMVLAQRFLFLTNSFARQEISGIYMLLTGLSFFFFLFLNFSSYVDMVQGVSQIFNVQLKNNFHNRVYFSASRENFWKGWHITLNEWFRDYVFFNLAKYDRKRKYTDYFLLLTFLLIALWHGFTLVLFIWGLCNGLWILLEKKIKNTVLIPAVLSKYFGIPYHLFFSGILALIFISPNISQTVTNFLFKPGMFQFDFLVLQSKNLLILLAAFLVMDYHNRKAKNLRIDEYFTGISRPDRWLIYFKLIFFILFFGREGSIDNFYMRF